MGATEILWACSLLGTGLSFGAGYVVSRRRSQASHEADADALAQEHARATTAEQRATTAEQRATAAEQRAAEFDRTTQQVRALEASLASERAAAEGLQRVAAQAKATETRRAMLETRVSELESATVTLAEVTQQRDRLQSELAAVRTQASTRGPVAAPTHPSAPAPLRPVLDQDAGPGADDDGASPLNRQLLHLVRNHKSTAAVFSDDHGLVLSGTGRELTQEHLAVLASLARVVIERAEEFVGLEDVTVLELGNKKGEGLRFRFFAFEENPISLAWLGPNPCREDQNEDALIDAFPSAVGGP